MPRKAKKGINQNKKLFWNKVLMRQNKFKIYKRFRINWVQIWRKETKGNKN